MSDSLLNQDLEEDEETGQSLITMFSLKVPESLLQRTVIVSRYYEVEYHPEMYELLQHASVQGKFELVLKNLEKYVWEFVLLHHQSVQMSEAEQALGLDLTRVFFLRIRSYILNLCEPVH